MSLARADAQAWRPCGRCELRLSLYETLTRHRQLLGLRRPGAAVDAPFSDLASPPAGKLRKNQAIFFHPVQLLADAAIAGHAQSHCRPMVLSGFHKHRICEGRAAHAIVTARRSLPNTARPLQAAADAAPPAFRPGHGTRDAQPPNSPKRPCAAWCKATASC